MRHVERLLQRSCQSVAQDLNIQVTSPFTLLDSCGSAHSFIALFEQFGSGKGVLICHADEWVTKNQIAASQGYYCSGLHPDSYGKYDRALWIEALEEWGWRGAEQDRPEWCRGSLRQQ